MYIFTDALILLCTQYSLYLSEYWTIIGHLNIKQVKSSLIKCFPYSDDPHCISLFKLGNYFLVDVFRAHLVNSEHELILLREENTKLKGLTETDRRRIKDLEDRLVNAESANNSLQRRVQASHQAKTVLENEVRPQISNR